MSPTPTSAFYVGSVAHERLLRYGPMSARAWLLIHFQALRIVAKRIRCIPRTPPPDKETSW